MQTVGTAKAPRRRRRIVGTLSFRLGLTVAIGILVTSMVTTVGVVQRTVRERIDDREAEIQSFARVLAANLSGAIQARDRDATLNVLRSIQYSPTIAFGEVRSADGTRIAQIGYHVQLVGQPASAFDLDALFGAQANISVTTPVRHGGEVVGELTLGGETPQIGRKLRTELTSAGLWTLLSILAGVLVAVFQQRRIVHPILSLTQRMRAAQRERRVPDPVHTNADGEIAVLVDSYNRMITEIAKRDAEIASHYDHLEAKVERRTHELRVARDEAQAAMVAKSRFLATMSHEIRTPMNGVLVMAELLARSQLPPAQKGYADVIARSGRSLLDLLDNILDLSKLEADRISLETIPVSPDELLHDSATIFWEQARTKSIALATYVDPQVPSTFPGDPARLRQCLTNLIGNAVKFTESGSVLVSAVMERGGESLLLAVRDTGVGIPKDRQVHIFEAFAQADQSTTRRHGGTGLGLAISAQLAEAMGGTIGLESAPGVGSRFTISLPLRERPEPPRNAWPALSLAIHSSCETTRQVLARALAERGIGLVEPGPGEAVAANLATLDMAAAAGPEPTIGIWPIGQPEPRAALESGLLQDVLPYPFRRADLDDLLDRIAAGALRGSEALTSAEPAAGTAMRFSGLHVLVADDSQVNRQVFADALAVLGVVPTLVEDGRAAVEAAGETDFDIVILDGNMPVLDGFDAAREIRAQEVAQQMARRALILASAHLDAGEAPGWLEAGFDAALTKPFGLAKLEALLAEFAAEKATFADTEDEIEAPDTERRAAEGSALDPKVFANLRELDRRRPGAMHRILASFIDALPGAIAELEKASDSGDAEEVRRAAHSLKSMTGSAGARRLADFAADLEHRAAEAVAASARFNLVEADLRALQCEVDAATEAVRTETPLRRSA